MVRLLYGSGRVVQLAHRSDERCSGRALDFLGEESARSLLARYAEEPRNLLALRAFLAERPASPPIHRLSNAEVIALVGRDLAAGRARAFERPTERLWGIDGDGELEPEAATAPEPARERKTWIEIELVDLVGQPVQGARYWIQLPDGSVREGNLDARGRARFDELDPGICEIRWPDLDEEAVSVATTDLHRREARPEPVPFEPGAPSPAALHAADQARSLELAARAGVPFCEECERRRKQPKAMSAR